MWWLTLKLCWGMGQKSKRCLYHCFLLSIGLSLTQSKHLLSLTCIPASPQDCTITLGLLSLGSFMNQSLSHTLFLSEITSQPYQHLTIYFQNSAYQLKRGQEFSDFFFRAVRNEKCRWWYAESCLWHFITDKMMGYLQQCDWSVNISIKSFL